MSLDFRVCRALAAATRARTRAGYTESRPYEHKPGDMNQLTGNINRQNSHAGPWPGGNWQSKHHCCQTHGINTNA